VRGDELTAITDMPVLSLLQGEPVTDGIASGVALVTAQKIAFNLGVDERTGLVVERGHELEGRSLAGTVLVFAGGKGSTASSFSLLQMVSGNNGPVAMVNIESDAIVAAGAVLAGIPLVHRCDANPVEAIKSGDLVRVDGFRGTVELLRRAE
jgi:predicted aconitase with swiveling domain